MAFRVFRTIAAIAVFLVSRLLYSERPCVSCASTMGVNVVDLDVESLRHRAELLRVAVLRPRTPQQNHSVHVHIHFGVTNTTVGTRLPHPLTKAESLAEPSEGAGDILVKEVRGDTWH